MNLATSLRGRARRALNWMLDVSHIQRSGDFSSESIYQYLFVRDINALGISDHYYPIGAAASYGLLYLLTRCLVQFQFDDIVEFGAGQSTLLIDELLGRLGRDTRFLTFEQDAWWAEAVGRGCRNPVAHTPLIASRVGGHDVMFYDVGRVERMHGASLVLIDGPAAWRHSERYNRMGAVTYLAESLGDEFIVIFDDAERIGETEAISTFRAALTAQDKVFFEHTIRGAKPQSLFCTRAFRDAAYY